MSGSSEVYRALASRLALLAVHMVWILDAYAGAVPPGATKVVRKMRNRRFTCCHKGERELNMQRGE